MLSGTHARYGELLREIRLGNVERVDFFENDEMLEDRSQFQPLEGPCLVLFKDSRVGQAYVPRYDVRIPCAHAPDPSYDFSASKSQRELLQSAPPVLQRHPAAMRRRS